MPGKTYRADGWFYRDLPLMTPPFFDELVELIGEGNIVWLTQATYPGGDRRGQMLVSPDGMARLRARAEATPAASDTLAGDEGEAGVNP